MKENEIARIEGWIGLDVGKEAHHATAAGAAGERLFEAPVGNDEAAIEQLLDRAQETAVRDRDRPAGLDRLARRLRGATARRPGRLRAGTGDAPCLGALPRRGEDRPARQVRPRRHGPHPCAAPPLARSSPRSVTSTGSRQPATSPPTPASPRSPASPAPR